jgi:hypothetical protein
MNNAIGCCSHGVPTSCYCRWCTEGGQPVVEVPLTEAERDARKASIRADWAKQLKRGRK